MLGAGEVTSRGSGEPCLGPADGAAPDRDLVDSNPRPSQTVSDGSIATASHGTDVQTSSDEGANEGLARDKGAKLEAGTTEGTASGDGGTRELDADRGSPEGGGVGGAEGRVGRAVQSGTDRAVQGDLVSGAAHGNGALPFVGGGDTNGMVAVRGGTGARTSVAGEVGQTQTCGNGQESRDLLDNSIGGTLAAELEGKCKCPIADGEAIAQEGHGRWPLVVSDIWAFKSRMAVFPSCR